MASAVEFSSNLSVWDFRYHWNNKFTLLHFTQIMTDCLDW